MLKCISEDNENGVVLDVVESLCRLLKVEAAQQYLRDTADETIARINRRFLESGVGYEFNVDANQLIRIDNQAVHAGVVRPALAVFSQPSYATANEEFLEAWEDYRKGDFDDCLTKCCSAFESLLKLICDDKNVPFQQNDTAQALVEKVVGYAPELEPYFQTLLMIIATLRNRLSSSHGDGTNPTNVPDYLARYALTDTRYDRA